MLTYPEALALLHQLPVEGRTERRALLRAGGLIAAQEVRIDRDQPGFDRSTMDGYAVCLDGDRDRFEVVGTVLAGQTHDGELAPGQAVRIMTGAPCPRGVTVVPIECTDGGDAEVHVTEAERLAPGRNIAWRGEDAHAGDVLVERGTRLGPGTLSVAAMAGLTEVQVWVPPRVAVVTTGDEVGCEGPAGIRDSNGPLLESLLCGSGSPVTRSHARDEEGALEAAIAAGAAAAEVVVTTGGVSMGSHDLVPDTIARLGFETIFHKVAVQPGKPILIARQPETGRVFCGLPGNPVSVLATAHLFLLEALALFTPGWRPQWFELPIACDHVHTGRRHLFLPATLDGGVRPVRWNGSGDLIAAATGDGLVDLPVGTDLKQGDLVRFLPFVGHQLGETGTLPPRGPRG